MMSDVRMLLTAIDTRILGFFSHVFVVVSSRFRFAFRCRIRLPWAPPVCMKSTTLFLISPLLIPLGLKIAENVVYTA